MLIDIEEKLRSVLSQTAKRIRRLGSPLFSAGYITHEFRAELFLVRLADIQRELSTPTTFAAPTEDRNSSMTEASRMINVDSESAFVDCCFHKSVLAVIITKSVERRGASSLRNHAER